jgi:CDP-diacylglycerol--serine O-phosphatidyltransferase
MVAVGGMMISRLRTPSLKRATIAASSAPFVLVGAVAAVAAVITYPWATLLLISAAYLAGVIWIALRRLRRGAA